MYDLIIIGGGPAGLTAAIYALRKRLDVLLISKDLGGKTNWRLQIPNIEQHLVINGEEVVNRFVNEIHYLDFARILDKVEKIEPIAGGYRVFTRGGKTHEHAPASFDAKALIVATGAQGKALDVPGEREYLMRGLCFSAISYASLFIDRTGIVVGDTRLALMAALELAQVARQVTLVAPTHGELDTPLGKHLQTLPNVLILEEYAPVQVNGDDFARSLVIKKGDDQRELATDVIFVELGLKPNAEFLANLIELEPDGRIKIDNNNRASLPGIFAAGDVTNVYAEQVLIAVGEGAKAALAAYEYLLAQPVDEHTAIGEWR